MTKVKSPTPGGNREERTFSMSEFVPINTQEEFDAAIKDRIERERQKFGDYDEIKTQRDTALTAVAEHEQTITQLKSDIDGLKLDAAKTKIAHEYGLPQEMASRLTGSNDEEIRKDAEGMSALFKAQAPVLPLADTAPKVDKNADTHLVKLLNDLRGES